MAHTSLNFDHEVNPRQSPIANVLIYHRQYWGDAWQLLSNVRFDNATFCIAPSVPHAQFSHRYGYGMQPDAGAFAVEAPLDLTRHFVKIQFNYQVNDALLLTEVDDNLLYESGDFVLTEPYYPGPAWYGQVEIAADKQDGAVNGTIKMGDESILALGLYNLLDQHRISTAIWQVPAGSQVQSSAGFTFNKDGHGNRKSTKPAGQEWYPFDYDKDPDASTWSTYDIVEYLIRSKTGVPLDESGNQDIVFEVDDADLGYLPTWDAPELETHYVSMTQILNALINRRRLLTWWLEVDDATNIVKLRIKTMTGTGITLPSGETIIANQDTVDMDWSNSATTSIVQQTDTSHKVHQVIAYGAKRTNTFTGTFGAASTDHFQPGWDSTQESTYEAAGSGHADYPSSSEVAERRRWHARFRGREEVKPVYRRWTVNDTLDWPKDDPDNYGCFFENVRLIPTLPFLAGVDYSVSTPTFPGNGELERRGPLVIIKVPGSSPARYVKLDEIGRAGFTEGTDEQDIRDWSATVRIPKDGKTLTIDVVGAPQHTIAYADFTPRTEDEQDHGQWDWNTITATVSMEDERFAEGRYPADADVDITDAKRIIRIPAGKNYRLDWISDDCTLDLDDNGALITRLSGYYHNDSTEILTDVAAQAYTWYSLTRQSVRVYTTWDAPCNLLNLGDFVTAITHKTLADTAVNAVISQIELEAFHYVGQEPREEEMPTMKMRLSTAHGELDWAHLKANTTL